MLGEVMSRLLIASNNPGKVREFQDLLALDDLEILTPAHSA
jgi:inosine/xanthosine triphosphate pyrophosphatase family protein